MKSLVKLSIQWNPNLNKLFIRFEIFIEKQIVLKNNRIEQGWQLELSGPIGGLRHNRHIGLLQQIHFTG